MNNLRLLQVKFKHKIVLPSIIFIVTVFLYGLLSILLGQDVNWDKKNYHFYSGYSFLNGRINYDYVPAHIQTFFQSNTIRTYIYIIE